MKKFGIPTKNSDFYTLFKDAQDAIVLFDDRATILEANPAACDLLGRSSENIVNSSLPDYLDSGADFDLWWKKFLQEGKTEGEIRLKNSRGEQRETEIRSVANISEGRHLSILRDVTARRSREELLTQKANELARSNEELEQFSLAASHDMQEPLNKIISFLELIDRHRPMDAKEKDYFNRIQSGVGRMKSLINDLLEYAKLGTVQKEFETVDLTKLIDRVFNDLAFSLNGVKTEIVLHPMPLVRGNPIQLRQLFQNLLSNSLKFRNKDQMPLIEIRGQKGPAGMIQIELKDNGIGFDPKFAEKIFKPFERLHGRSMYAGSGLGLAICRRVVEMHGGSIQAQSRPGEGCAFLFTLPADLS